VSRTAITEHELVDCEARAIAALSGAALMAVSALTRFGVFEAGGPPPGTRSTRSGRNANASAN
jgi:hypothetical protein